MYVENVRHIASITLNLSVDARLETPEKIRFSKTFRRRQPQTSQVSNNSIGVSKTIEAHYYHRPNEKRCRNNGRTNANSRPTITLVIITARLFASQNVLMSREKKSIDTLSPELRAPSRYRRARRAVVQKPEKCRWKTFRIKKNPPPLRPPPPPRYTTMKYVGFRHVVCFVGIAHTDFVLKPCRASVCFN